MIDRMRQGLNFIYCKYTADDDKLVRKHLSSKEYEIFKEMCEYDRVHSVELLKVLLDDKVLYNKSEFLKLALLHDCGKGKVGLFRRVKKVLVGDKMLEAHAERSYLLLKGVNLKVATLARKHHIREANGDLRRFQKLDDYC